MGLQQSLREHWPEYLMEGWDLGMLLAVEIYRLLRFSTVRMCAKLDHAADRRCIHCGCEPVANYGHGGPPVLDYDPDRIPDSVGEHRAIIKTFKACLLRCGLLSVSKPMGLTGTAHALGSLVTGRTSTSSVVDANGKVHGMDNLYVADGSVLPRASRVNPALTIYAWGLRLGQWLIREEQA